MNNIKARAEAAASNTSTITCPIQPAGGFVWDHRGSYPRVYARAATNRPAEKTAESLVVPIIFRWPQPGVGEDDILNFLRMVDSIRKSNRTAPVADDEGDIFEIERSQKYLMILTHYLSKNCGG